MKRGSFYNGFSRTVQGMTGSILRKDPDIEVPKEIEDILPNITASNKSFYELTRSTCDEVISFGRLGLLVDMPSENTSGKAHPYIALYKAQDILNWRSERVDGEDKLTMLVLREIVQETNPADVFSSDEVEQIRVLRLIDIEGNESVTGQLEVAIYKEQKSGKGKKQQWVEVEKFEPSILGKRSLPTRMRITGNIKKGISTLPWIINAIIRQTRGERTFDFFSINYYLLPNQKIKIPR